MKTLTTAVAAGVVVVGGGAVAAALTAGGSSTPARVNLVAASSPAGSADQAAVPYVDQHYPGSGTANVLQNEADHEHGIAVFDVRIKAPNGAIYSVTAQTSNDQVMSAQVAEGTQAPSGSGALPSSTQSSGQSQEPVQTPEPKQTSEPNSAGSSSGDNSPDQGQPDSSQSPDN